MTPIYPETMPDTIIVDIIDNFSEVESGRKAMDVRTRCPEQGAGVMRRQCAWRAA
jgi:hypothetical protein